MLLLLLYSCSWPSETSRLTTGGLLLKCINVIKKEATRGQPRRHSRRVYLQRYIRKYKM